MVLKHAPLGEINLPFVATDAKSRAESSLLELCRDAKEENSKLTDAHSRRRRMPTGASEAMRTSVSSVSLRENNNNIRHGRGRSG